MIKNRPDNTNAMLRDIEGIIKRGVHKTIIITVTAQHNRLAESRIASTFFVVIDDDHRPTRSVEESIDNYFLDRCMVALDVVSFSTC